MQILDVWFNLYSNSRTYTLARYRIKNFTNFTMSATESKRHRSTVRQCTELASSARQSSNQSIYTFIE